MKKNLLFLSMLLMSFFALSAQTVVFGDDFESYDDNYNLADAGYILWEGGAIVSDVTIDGGTAGSGNKFAVCQPSAGNYYFRKTLTVEAGKSYNFSAMTKSPGAKNHRIGYVLGTNAAVVAPLVNSTEWTLSTLSFTPAEGETSIVLYLYSFPVSEVDLDDFKLVEEVNIKATLASLSIDAGTLVPAFEEFTFNYTAELQAGTTTTPTITATASEEGSNVVIVNATDVTSANAADRTSTVTVTGTDGITQNVYSIVFNVAASNDASLSALSLSEGTLSPAFDAATKAYTAELPYGTIAAPTVTATATNSKATVVITDATDVSSAIEADRTTTIVVTAEDLTTTDTYTIVFSIAPNNDATLSTLTLSTGTLVPDFAAATMAYTAELPAGTTETPTATATAADANADVVITPATDVNSETLADRTTTIVVTAEDGTTKKTYTVVFSVIDETPYAYMPVFTDDFEGYENAFSLADTGYILWEGGAYVVDVAIETGEAAASSGTKYAKCTPSKNNFYFRRPLELEEGADYVFEVMTRSPGGMNHRAVAQVGSRSVQGPLIKVTEWTKTTIEFTVGAGETSAIFWIYSYPVSRVDVDDFMVYKKVNASGTLSALSIDAGTLDPEFDQLTFDYLANLPAGTSTAPTVTATPTQDGATVSITNATDVTSANEADRTTTIQVTSVDEGTTGTYTIVFSVAVSVSETMAGRFAMYPNPASDHIYINNAEEIRSVSIHSLAGQEIMQQAAFGQAILRLDVAGLVPGVYLIRVKDKGQNSYTDRFIKK